MVGICTLWLAMSVTSYALLNGVDLLWGYGYLFSMCECTIVLQTLVPSMYSNSSITLFACKDIAFWEYALTMSKQGLGFHLFAFYPTKHIHLRWYDV